MAGGSGTRMFPSTYFANKHFLQIYDRPLIFFPLSTLIDNGINEIYLISSKEHSNPVKKLQNYFLKLNIKINFIIQDKPKGIAQGISLLKDFKKSDFLMILGDNVLILPNEKKHFIDYSNKKSSLFTYKVDNPEQFGVYDKKKNLIIEKPNSFISNNAVTGIYFYKKDIFNNIKKIKKSNRGEYEITDINNILLKENLAEIDKLPNNSFWKDCGTLEDFLFTNNKLSCTPKLLKNISFPEISSLNSGFIDIRELEKIITRMPDNLYKHNLLKTLKY